MRPSGHQGEWSAIHLGKPTVAVPIVPSRLLRIGQGVADTLDNANQVQQLVRFPPSRLGFKKKLGRPGRIAMGNSSTRQNPRFRLLLERMGNPDVVVDLQRVNHPKRISPMFQRQLHHA
jgi:hypothetical protein